MPIYFLPPQTPLLYSKTGVYRGIHYFSYFCSKHRLWVLVRTASVLTSTHNLCFEQKYEKYLCFLSEFFQFLEVKFSIYLNRRVFVMRKWLANRCVAILETNAIYPSACFASAFRRCCRAFAFRKSATGRARIVERISGIG